jgi:hypothetical protein
MVMARFKSFSLLLVLLLLAGCGRYTELVSVSRDDGARSGSYSQLFLVNLTAEQDTRRAVEKALAIKLKEAGVGITASHKVAPELDLEDRDALHDRIRRLSSESPAQAVLVVVLEEVSDRMDYVAPLGPDLTTPGLQRGERVQAHYDWGGGYFRAQREYRVRTSLYDQDSGREIWRALTVTRNPRDRERSIREFADLIADRLREDGLLPGR